MICPICHKREATRNIIRRFGNAILQGDVCENCYAVASSFDRETFYRAFIENGEKQCRFCGRTLAEIESTLLVGCQGCYTEFRYELQPIIDRLQGK